MSHPLSVRPVRASAAIPVLALAVVALGACSDDDDPTYQEPTIVGSWQATSFEALGTNFIAAGMTLDLTMSDTGTYTITVTNDLVDVCGGETNCTTTGPYTSTATQITIDAGKEDEVTFDYTVTSTTMTWTGTIDENSVTVSFVRE